MKNSKGNSRRRFIDTGPTILEPHWRPNVDVSSANAGATPIIGGSVVLLLAHRFGDGDYEPFAHVDLTQEFLDRLYRLARIAHQECLEYLEVEHRIMWNIDMYRRRPQHLRIARNHFYWTGSSPYSWVEANTAPVFFSDLEEKLAPGTHAPSQVIFVGIDDPDDQDDVLREIMPKVQRTPERTAEQNVVTTITQEPTSSVPAP